MLLPRSYTHFCKNCSSQIDSPGHTYMESFFQLVIGSLSGVNKHWPCPFRRKFCLECGDSKLCAGYLSGMKRKRRSQQGSIESIGFNSATKLRASKHRVASRARMCSLVSLLHAEFHFTSDLLRIVRRG